MVYFTYHARQSSVVVIAETVGASVVAGDGAVGLVPLAH